MAATRHAAPTATTAHASCFVHRPSWAPGIDVALYTMSSPTTTRPSAAIASGPSMPGMRSFILVTRGLRDRRYHLHRVVRNRDPWFRLVAQRVGDKQRRQHLGRLRCRDGGAVTAV